MPASHPQKGGEAGMRCARFIYTCASVSRLTSLSFLSLTIRIHSLSGLKGLGLTE
jgi:hypothetical protein